MNTNDKIFGIDDLKSSYPDEWILLGNPEWDEHRLHVRSGTLLYHSPDKREAAYSGKPLTKNYEKITLFFNRVTPRGQRGVIASVYGEVKI
jgi:hypothetical protein